MNSLRKLLEDRRKVLQSVAWLRPVLLAIDLILLVAGLFISPVQGIVLGLLLILLNEWLTPVLVQRVVFVKDLGGNLRMSGTLTTKVIRHSPPSNMDKE